MIAAIQHAHYALGRTVVEHHVLVEAAGTVGLDHDRFVRSLRQVPVDAHIRETRDLMQRERLGGYPSFLLERDGALTKVPHETFYGHPEGFVAA